MNEPTILPVDPIRLEWPHGDVVASHSADRIAEGKTIRPPFKYRGEIYVKTGAIYDDGKTTVDAMRLVQIEDFDGTPTTYAEKIRPDRGDKARNDPLGFYHGMTVTSRSRTFVMIGPKVKFVASDELVVPNKQMSLF